MLAHIQMTRSTQGSDDGVTVRRFVVGTQYRVTSALAQVFVQHGDAVYVDAEKQLQPVTEDKMQRPVIENKQRTKRRHA